MSEGTSRDSVAGALGPTKSAQRSNLQPALPLPRGNRCSLDGLRAPRTGPLIRLRRPVDVALIRRTLNERVCLFDTLEEGGGIRAVVRAQ